MIKSFILKVNKLLAVMIQYLNNQLNKNNIKFLYKIL